MMIPERTEIDGQATSREDFGELLEHIAEQLRVGQPVNVAGLQQRYPEYAEQIVQLLPTLEAMVELGQPDDTGSVSRSAEEAHAPSKTLGDFRIIRELGRGGMGVVYEAEQISMGRNVALKVLPFAALAHERALQRFRNEVRAAAALDHKNIVSVFSVGEERGVHFFAMQLIRGQTLAQIIQELAQRRNDSLPHTGESIQDILSAAHRQAKDERSEHDVAEPTEEFSSAGNGSGGCLTTTRPNVQAHLSTLSWSDHAAEFYRSVARLGIQAAEALQHAHDQGVLHRDIKPGNLILDAGGQLFITDFGLARIEAEVGVTMTGDLVGTLRYMSPEQLLAKRVVIDHRADIYSLGVTLYELLVQRPTFTADNRQELLHQIAFNDPPQLRKLDRNLPRELETIVFHAIEKLPDERYATAQELADDLQAFLDNRLLLAIPPTLWDRGVKWSRRNRPLVWSLAISTAGLLIGSVIVLAISNALVAQQRDIADRKSATADAVVQFINQDLLGAADPMHEPDRDVKLKTVVDRAAAGIDDRFADQPLVAASIRMTLGQTYRSLGEYAVAREQFEKALELFQKQLGPTHPDTLDCQRHLANVFIDLGMDVEAERLHRIVFEERVRSWGDTHPDSLQSMNDLAVLARVCGRPDAARLLMHHVVAVRAARLGAQAPLTLESKHEYALVLQELKKVALAERSFTFILAARKKTLGPKHPDTLETQLSLATLHLDQQKSELSYSEFADLLSSLRELLGPEHPRTILCMQRLALSCIAQQQLAEATQLLSDAHRIASRKLSDDHPIVLQVDFAMARNSATQGDYQTANEKLQHLLDQLFMIYGAEHPLTVAAKIQLANVYQELGRTDEADELRANPELTDGSFGYLNYSVPFSYRVRVANLAAKRAAEQRQRAAGQTIVPGFLMGHDVRLEHGARQARGVVGVALVFHGVRSRAFADDVPEFAFDKSLTIHCWVRVDAFPDISQGQGIIVMRADNRSGRDAYWLACLPTGIIEFGVCGDAEGAAISAPVQAAVWTHIAATLDDVTGSLRLFIDGQEMASRMTDVRPLKELESAASPGLGIGNHGGAQTIHNFPFNGLIDEVQLFDRAFSPQEVADCFKRGIPASNRPSETIRP